MDKVKVRVSLFDEPIEVSEDEIPGLRSQGLLVEDEPAASEATASGDGSAPAAGKRTGKPAAE